MDAVTEYSEVTLSIDLAATKAYTQPINRDNAIYRIAYLAFNKAGRLLNYQNVNLNTTATTQVTMTLPYGTVTIYAVANIQTSVFKNIKNTYDLYNTLVPHYLINSSFQTPMMGKVTLDLKSKSQSAGIILSSYMTRLYIKSIKNSLTGRYEGKSMLFKYAYLTNLQGGFYIDNQINCPIWYSQFGRPDSNKSMNARITSIASLRTWQTFTQYNKEIAHGKRITLPPLASSFLYAFPNYTKFDQTGWSEVFTERYTRLVAVIEIDGIDYYYPINLVNMQPGMSHDVYIKITKLGSLDPDTFDFVEMNDVIIDFGGLDDGFDIEIEM